MISNITIKRIILMLVLLILIPTIIIPNLIVVLLSTTNISLFNFHDIQFTYKHIKIALSNEYIRKYFSSIIVGILTTISCLIISFPYSYITYKQKKPLPKKLLFIIIAIPFFISSLVRGYSILTILRKKGIINEILISSQMINEPINFLYKRYTIILGLSYILIPFMIFPIYLSLRRINNTIIEAAKDLGASQQQIFFKIIMPFSYDGIITGSNIVFLSSISMFYISDLLGGGKYYLIGNYIQDNFLLYRNWNLGSAISLIIYFIVLIFIVLNKTSNNFKKLY